MNSNFFRNIFNKAKEAGGREFLQAKMVKFILTMTYWK